MAKNDTYTREITRYQNYSDRDFNQELNDIVSGGYEITSVVPTRYKLIEGGDIVLDELKIIYKE